MYCKTVIITTCFIANCSVFAGLQGETFHLGSELTDTPLQPGGLVEDFGNFVVGDGIEWSQTYPVWDFQDPQVPLIGEYTYFLDVGDDYIEITATWTLFQGDPADPYLSYFSLLPAEFYGFHLNFVNPTNLSANQQFQITSTNAPVGQMGDLNLFAKTNPPLEQWVDSQSVDPISPTRITVGETSLDLNTQGIAWGCSRILQELHTPNLPESILHLIVQKIRPLTASSMLLIFFNSFPFGDRAQDATKISTTMEL